MPIRRRILPGWIPLLITVLSTTGAIFLCGRQLPAQSSQDEAPLPTPAALTAFPVQLAPGFDGIVVIDPQNRTLCVYQYKVRNPAHERLVLLAARTLTYDLQLDDYNNADPRPATVRQWLQRASGGTDRPTEPVDEDTTAPPVKTEPPADKESAWRSPADEPKSTTSIPDDGEIDSEQEPSNAAQPLVHPPRLPAIIPLRCANPECEFSGHLSAGEFIIAANGQIRTLQYNDPQRYNKLLISAQQQLPELNDAENPIRPATAYEMILVNLVENWGDLHQGLGFTCIRCGKDEVYRAIECKQCEEIYLPPPDPTGQRPHTCPQCGAIQAVGGQEKPSTAEDTIQKVN